MHLTVTMLVLRLVEFVESLASTGSVSGITGRNERTYKNVAYLPNWVVEKPNFNFQNLDASALTHLVYAFANVRSDTGQVYLSDLWIDTKKRFSYDSWNDTGTNVHGCAKQLFLLKKHNRNLKVLLSIGGGIYSSNFAQPASTSQGRSHFAQSAIQILKDLGFDGLDIDWEYPQEKSEANNFVLLLAETRKQLNEYSIQYANRKHLLLTVASSAVRFYYKNMNLAAMDKYLDFWNLMAYDYSNPQNTIVSHTENWNFSLSNPESTPSSTQQAIDDYNREGIPHAKIVIGISLQGRSFANTDGPGKPFWGVGQGSGVYEYRDLPKSGSTLNTDDMITASWTYDPGRRILISFDTPDIIKRKTRFIMSQGLGGSMWWELSSDKKGHDSLISTFVDSVGSTSALEQDWNLLTFPTSKYDNVKAGMPNE